MTSAKSEGRTALSAEKTLDEPSSKETLAPLVFRDNVYTSRTLILPDGRAVPVAKGRVTAVDAALLDYLNQHEDFKPLE